MARRKRERVERRPVAEIEADMARIDAELIDLAAALRARIDDAKAKRKVLARERHAALVSTNLKKLFGDADFRKRHRERASERMKRMNGDADFRAKATAGVQRAAAKRRRDGIKIVRRQYRLPEMSADERRTYNKQRWSGGISREAALADIMKARLQTRVPLLNKEDRHDQSRATA